MQCLKAINDALSNAAAYKFSYILSGSDELGGLKTYLGFRAKHC